MPHRALLHELTTAYDGSCLSPEGVSLPLGVKIAVVAVVVVGGGAAADDDSSRALFVFCHPAWRLNGVVTT